MASWLVRSTPERAVRVWALGGDILLCSWARHCTLTVPLSTQVYKWVPANCWGNLAKLRGSDLQWTSIPCRGSRNTSSRFMLQKPDKLWQPWASLGSKASLLLFFSLRNLFAGYWLTWFQIFLWCNNPFTVAPRYNKPHYNEDSVITNNIWKASRITVKYVETNPTITNPAIMKSPLSITNWFWQSQRTYLVLSLSVSQSVSKNGMIQYYYKWLISQTRLVLVKTGKLWPSKLCFI